MMEDLDPRRSTSQNGPMRQFAERTDRVRGHAHDLVSELEGGVGDLQAALQRELESHPYATLATALGAGWVLGGIMPSWRATGALLLFGSRLLMITAAQRVAQKGESS
jgi:hypothetical protein